MEGHFHLVFWLFVAVILFGIVVDIVRRYRQHCSATEVPANFSMKRDNPTMKSHHQVILPKSKKERLVKSKLPGFIDEEDCRPVQYNLPGLGLERVSEKRSLLQEGMLFLTLKSSKKIGINIHALQRQMKTNRLVLAEDKMYHFQSQSDSVYSVAQASEDGQFNFDKSNRFIPGLVLYFDTTRVESPLTVFNSMLDVAQVLSFKLKGSLFSSENVPLTKDLIEQYRQALSA
jgi:hypothetical protein